MSTATGWDLVAEQRIAFADMIERLEDQADHATLCGHWNVHEVAGHLLTFTNLSVLRLMRDLIKSRFDYDVMNDKIAQLNAAIDNFSTEADRGLSDKITKLNSDMEVMEKDLSGKEERKEEPKPAESR